MARSNRRKSGFDKRWVMFLILSVILVLSMVLAYLPGIIGGPR